MRRIAIIGAVVGTGALVVRMRGHKLHERLMAHCEAMFERMPDTFPPKKMLRGIEDIQATTARIQELLDAEYLKAAQAQPHAAREAVHHAA
jgi:hypothetical protein